MTTPALSNLLAMASAGRKYANGIFVHDGRPRWERMVGAILAGSGGGGAAPLRFATANNYFPINLVGFAITNNAVAAPQVEILQVDPHVVGADFTTLTPAITNQYLASNAGVKNLGAAISIIAMYVNYNGVTVGMTLSGATTATIADMANVLFDAMPSTLFGGAAKFSKGTILQFRMHFRTTAPSTQKFPSTNARLTGQQNIYYDPRKVNITNDVSGTGAVTYTMKSLAITSASASGTAVTALLADTSTLVSGTKYAIAGATGTGNQLNYNGTFAITVVDSGTITYTATSAPSATATGSLTVAALNGTDATFGVMIPMFALGNHSVVTPIFPGDSKTFGTGDTATAIGIQGLSRALFSNASTASTVVWPGCNFGCPNGVTNDAITAAGGSLANFEAWYAYGTHAIVGYGTNGFQLANQQTLYSHLRAKGITKIIQRSLTPRTTSTDSWATTANQTLSGSWGVGSAADTYEQGLIALVAGDANLAYYQSQAERVSGTVGTANYWLWFVNGTANDVTSDGIHEGGVVPGYELNIGTAGTIQTLTGGTVSTSLRAYVAALT